MKKILLAIVMASSSLSAMAEQKFSNDFLRFEQSKIQHDEDVDVSKISASVSITDNFFTEAYYSKLKVDNLPFEVKKTGFSFGYQRSLPAIDSAAYYAKLGMFKEKAKIWVFNPIKDKGLDAQIGLRWNYGLEQLDTKLFVGHQEYREKDEQNTYYGLEANYFLTKKVSLGASYIKHKSDGEAGLNIAYHW